MMFSANELASNTRFFNVMRVYAQQMTAMFAENPRLSSIFASQQRWLMAQLGLRLHYGRDPADPSTSFYAGRFVSRAMDYRIASRNTAAAFVQEMMAYRFLRASDNPPDNRMRPLEPTEIAIENVVKWLYAHLAILDTLDGGNRAICLTENPALFTKLQPIIAAGILENPAVRNPGETFTLFTWANSGGVVMDYFISMITEFDPDAPRTLIGPISSADVCQSYRISKTHLKRLMSKAGEMGSVAFETIDRRNMMWLSQSFIREYWNYQAEKFAIIDAAFHREAAPVSSVRQLTAVP